MAENKKSLVDTLRPHQAKYLELLTDQIETDPNQPRKAFGLNSGVDHNRLLRSIDKYGVEEPIKVSEVELGRYIIIDGHRRLACAKQLKIKTLPCRIYPKMTEGELEARRYEMQNNRRDWQPIEKANAIHKIKTEYNNASEKEIADLIGVKQSTLFHFEQMRNMRMEYLELMAEHDLKEFQRVEFIKLLPKLRKVKQYQVDDIVKILFTKISNNLLYKRDDFISLRRIFTMASFNEEELFKFLSKPKVSIIELCEGTQLSGLSNQIKLLIKDLALKRKLDVKLTDKEQFILEDLYKLVETFV